MNTDVTAEQLNRYVKLVKERWDDNAVEAVVGAMSTVISARQMEVLIEDLIDQLEEIDK
jgi:uncharacterized protein YqgV (UPF0045/DUF77 family)